MTRWSAFVVAVVFAGVLGWNAIADHRPRISVPLDEASSAPTSCHVRGRGLFVLPDPRCTPGEVNPNVIQATIGQTICEPNWSRTMRPPESVTEPEKRRLAIAYGYYAGRRLGAYQLDHVIAISLGGAANSSQNLWPEANYPRISPDSYYPNPKDRLESRLRSLVCRDRMPLTQAQHILATDWVASYRRYVR
jgi:hypothetical protein